MIFLEVMLLRYCGAFHGGTRLNFFSRAEIFKLGCFVQKYSDLGVSCSNICQVPFRVTQSEKCILEKVTQMVLSIMEKKAKQCIR